MSPLLGWRALFEAFDITSAGERGFLPVTAHELEELKRRCGASAFPPVYVDMVTSLGNIAFRNSVSLVAPSGETFGVAVFFGGAPASMTLRDVYEVSVRNDVDFPSYMVPFARDFGGWTLVFDSRDVLGPVWCDRGDEALVPVANSFDEFIMGLRVDSDD